AAGSNGVPENSSSTALRVRSIRANASSAFEAGALHRNRRTNSASRCAFVMAMSAQCYIRPHMNRFALAALLFATSVHAADFDSKAAERFANLALACVHKEYPNKISHNLN